MGGADKLKQNIRDIVHEVVDHRFDRIDSEFAKVGSQFTDLKSEFATLNSTLKQISDRLPPAPPSGNLIP